MRRISLVTLALALSLPLVGWAAFHLELTASHPEADGTVVEAPAEIWLQFSVAPDTAQSSFSVRGPDGSLELGDIVLGEEPEILRAQVKGAMPSGEYTVSWVGAPLDDHPVRGRYKFSVGTGN